MVWGGFVCQMFLTPPSPQARLSSRSQGGGSGEYPVLSSVLTGDLSLVLLPLPSSFPLAPHPLAGDVGVGRPMQ